MSVLNKTKLSVKILDSNATKHAFGALAEFLDNSRAANASNCKIFTETRDDLRGGCMLCFLDDGEGMDPSTVNNLLTSELLEKRYFLGEYGFKYRAMRLGKDFILFTKKNGVKTILLLSQTLFHDEHLVDEVIVPTASFNGHTDQPWFNDMNQNLQKHKEVMDLIYKYSPFATEKELFDKFKHLEKDTGNLLIIYNVHGNNNKPDLDVTSDPKDFLISSCFGIEPEKYSFREYASILYADPKMKIYIQESKVRAQRFQYSLFKIYKYKAVVLLQEKPKDIKNAESTLQMLKQKKIETDADASHALEIFASGPVVNKEGNKNSKLKQIYAGKINSQIMEMEKEIDQIIHHNNKTHPIVIELTFGLNVRNRAQDGYFIYNGNRLFRKCKSREFNENNDAPGIVAMVDIPLNFLTPNNKKLDVLLDVFDEHLQQYISDAQEDLRKDFKTFWQTMGYEGNIPNQDSEFRRQRFYKSPIILQCDSCLKWRMLRLHIALMDKSFSNDWTCKDQTNSPTKSCNEREELSQKITEGGLKEKDMKKNNKSQPNLQRATKRKATLDLSEPNKKQ